ncbi:hypothetical protein [Sorangium sp. So ce1151]|uniref:hypothetical protein n=1 Tax=Sorangium sp. So ce1151 TaxID=3133332 RepID=UPI003F631154
MTQTSALVPCAALLWLLASSACVKSTAQSRSPCVVETTNPYQRLTPCVEPAAPALGALLQAGKIPDDQGAVFGHIRVLYGIETITDQCRIVFADEKGGNQTQVRLDETGWVFTSVKRGTTSVAAIACYESRLDPGISFDVPGNGQIVYFGHLYVELANNKINWSKVVSMYRFLSPSTGGVAGLMIASAVGVAAAGAEMAERSARHDPNTTGVERVDLFDEARREYEGRFGKQAALLKPSDAAAFANSHLLPGQHGSLAAPPGAVPFVFGTWKWQAAASCKQDGRKWTEDGGGARCSGSTSAGIPGATSHLEFADGRLSAVELAISTPGDAEGWSKTFRDTHAELVRHYGKPAERSFVVPGECEAAEQFLGCVADGKVTGKSSWSLDDGRSVAMFIAGASSSAIHLRLTAAPPKPTGP